MARGSVAPASNRGGGTVRETERKGWRRHPPPREALAATCRRGRVAVKKIDSGSGDAPE
jgi:hypothetical protein